MNLKELILNYEKRRLDEVDLEVQRLGGATLPSSYKVSWLYQTNTLLEQAEYLHQNNRNLTEADRSELSRRLDENEVNGGQPAYDPSISQEHQTEIYLALADVSHTTIRYYRNLFDRQRDYNLVYSGEEQPNDFNSFEEWVRHYFKHNEVSYRDAQFPSRSAVDWLRGEITKANETNRRAQQFYTRLWRAEKNVSEASIAQIFRE